jgi:hypothetical protein
MSKTYTEHNFRARDHLTSEDHNSETRNWVSEFNGQLDAQQLPYTSFASTTFTDGIVMDGAFDTKPDGSRQVGVGQINATQAHYSVQSNITADTWERAPDDAPGVTIMGPPAKAFLSTSGEWSSGINPLSLDIDDGVFMRIPTREGMLRGMAQIDVEYMLVRQTTGGAAGTYGNDWRWQVFVFVDNLMVATSGPQPAGKRKSIYLPFSVPVPTKDNVEIDIRWAASFDDPWVASATVSLDDPGTVNFFNSHIYVRNQAR